MEDDDLFSMKEAVLFVLVGGTVLGCGTPRYLIYTSLRLCALVSLEHEKLFIFKFSCLTLRL